MDIVSRIKSRESSIKIVEAEINTSQISKRSENVNSSSQSILASYEVNQVNKVSKVVGDGTSNTTSSDTNVGESSNITKV